MQYEFSQESNRAFSRLRLALQLVALLVLLQLLFTIVFHLLSFASLPSFGPLILFGNVTKVVALVVLLVQSLSSIKLLRSIVHTSGNDLQSFMASLSSSRKALAGIAVLLLLDIFFAWTTQASFVSCLKVS